MATKPPVEVPQGAIRLNTDSQKLEFFAQDQWWEMTTEESSPIAPRGIIYSGRIASGNPSDIIDYINISTQGDAVDFGNATVAMESCADGAVCSATRCLKGGGYSGAHVNTIEYITIAQQGNGTDFGDLTRTTRACAGSSNSVRGVFSGGLNPTNQDTIDYVTMSSTGNAIDFGNLPVILDSPAGGLSSATRGMILGGEQSPAAHQISYITIMSTGNAQDFGDMSTLRFGGAGLSNAIRGYVGGGLETPSPYPAIGNVEYYTIASLGNGTNFGDLVLGGSRTLAGMASPTRGVWGGGTDGNGPTAVNGIEYITLATQGDSVDFGDIATARYESASGSNAHGGLG